MEYQNINSHFAGNGMFPYPIALRDVGSEYEAEVQWVPSDTFVLQYRTLVFEVSTCRSYYKDHHKMNHTGSKFWCPHSGDSGAIFLFDLNRRLVIGDCFYLDKGDLEDWAYNGLGRGNKRWNRNNTAGNSHPDPWFYLRASLRADEWDSHDLKYTARHIRTDYVSNVIKYVIP